MLPGTVFYLVSVYPPFLGLRDRGGVSILWYLYLYPHPPLSYPSPRARRACDTRRLILRPTGEYIYIHYLHTYVYPVPPFHRWKGVFKAWQGPRRAFHHIRGAPAAPEGDRGQPNGVSVVGNLQALWRWRWWSLHKRRGMILWYSVWLTLWDDLIILIIVHREKMSKQHKISITWLGSRTNPSLVVLGRCPEWPRNAGNHRSAGIRNTFVFLARRITSWMGNQGFSGRGRTWQRALWLLVSFVLWKE